MARRSLNLAWTRRMTRRQKRQKDRPHWRHFCWYCGVETIKSHLRSPDQRTVDHVQPTSRAGNNHHTNRVNCCHGCNDLKGQLTLGEFRERIGGGLFWGEMFAPKPLEWTDDRPKSEGPFRRFLAARRTVGADDWMIEAEGARNARESRGVYRLRLPTPVRSTWWTTSCPCWWCRTVAKLRRIATRPTPGGDDGR